MSNKAQVLKGDKPVTVDMAIEVLNRMLATDPEGTNTFFKLAAGVNNELADDPTIQVAPPPRVPGKPAPPYDYCVRPLGLINGLFGVDSDAWGFIVCVMDNGGNITEFRRTTVSDKESAV